jgi:hypothetical protein
MNNQLVDYEIILLLAKYGEKPIVSALAKRLDLSPEDLQDQLSMLRALHPHRTSQRKPIDVSQIIESVASANPDKARSLKLLFARFQNRTFLKELREVKRFFERHNHPVSKIKSRGDAIPRLFRLLATLDVSELASLCDETDQKHPSSLGIISDQIMRRNG